MSILEYQDDEALGRVMSVDTGTVIIRVDDVDFHRVDIVLHELVLDRQSLRTLVDRVEFLPV